MDATVNPGLLLIGVGGGGCQAVAAAARLYGKGIHAAGFDTDTAAIRNIEGVRCVLLGRARLEGQGAAGDMVKGRLAAEEDLPGVLNLFEGVRTAVVVACLGGGTGGGATPVLLRQLAELGIATQCYTLMPWGFEDGKRMENARRALAAIEPRANTLANFAPEDLLADAGLDNNAAFAEVLARCGRVLSEHLFLLWRVLHSPGYIRFDAERLRALVMEGGSATARIGGAEGAGRAMRAAALLAGGRAKDRLSGVQTALLGILAGPDLRLVEIGEITNSIRAALFDPCNLEVATVLHDDYAGRVTLVLLAFDPVARTSTALPATPAAHPVVAREQLFIDEPAPADAPPVEKPARGKKGGSGLRPKPDGRFQGMEKTFINGENVDLPTYLRKNILLEK